MQFLEYFKDCQYKLDAKVHYIFEDENKPEFVEENEKWNLRVNAKSVIDFYQIDDCVIADNNYKRVDWMFLDDETIFFVEVKDVKTNQYQAARNDAWDKLIDTFKFFSEKGEKFEASTVKYVLNLYSKSKNTIGRVRNSSVNTRKVRYKKEFGVIYEEGNSIYFE